MGTVVGRSSFLSWSPPRRDPEDLTESEPAAVSGFYHTCAISEHPMESWQLERPGWAKPRIHSVDEYQWAGVRSADDSVAARK